MIDDDAIREIVVRLARPTRSGDHAIERAAILAEGSNCRDIEAWILRNSGEPESGGAGTSRGGHGLHAERTDARAAAAAGAPPTRYVLPATSLS